MTKYLPRFSKIYAKLCCKNSELHLTLGKVDFGGQSRLDFGQSRLSIEVDFAPRTKDKVMSLVFRPKTTLVVAR